jgi:hypothetical protein
MTSQYKTIVFDPPRLTEESNQAPSPIRVWRSPLVDAHKIASQILVEQIAALSVGKRIGPAEALQRLKKRGVV